jgi:hypothetical protein
LDRIPLHDLLALVAREDEKTVRLLLGMLAEVKKSAEADETSASNCCAPGCRIPICLSVQHPPLLSVPCVLPDFPGRSAK